MDAATHPGARTDKPAILLADARKQFGEVQAVKGISLTVAPGEVVAFLGPNGAGKTTTLDMVLGLSKPTSGEVAVFGKTPRQAVDSGQVAAVTQTGGLLSDVTVGDHVRLVAELFGLGRARAAEVMEEVQLTRLAKRKAQACSGGEKQRLKFAMALVPRPDLIVLDEPTAGMDVEARRAFWTDIHDQALGGRTILFATHYLEEADEYADRIVVIVAGQVVADGTAAEVKALASGRTVQADFADPARAQAAAAALGGAALGPRLTVSTKDSDAVVKRVFDLGGRDVLVSSQGLEEAFLALTEGNER